jgi:predicted metalloprotease with PDZ domain
MHRKNNLCPLKNGKFNLNRHQIDVRNSKRLLTVFVFFGISAAGTAQKPHQPIHFIVSMVEPDKHQFQVTMALPPMPADSLDLFLPRWTPGYYQLMGFARQLTNFKVSNGHWASPDSSSWRIYAPKGKLITVTYTIKAERRFVANPYLGSDHAYILPGGVFMYPTGMIRSPAIIHLISNPGWTAATGLSKLGSDYYAQDFDELYDEPILVGPLETLSIFTVKGVPHVFTGVDLGEFDKAGFNQDLKKIVEAGSSLIGDIPYDHYVFLAIGGGHGGIEHSNSCSLSFNGKDLQTENGRKRMLSFIAHEYFHGYNVKRIRPVELGPFDYQRENRTNLLWVSEGFTVYYEYILIKRAGITSADDFLKALEKNIAAYENTTGHLYQSLTEASYETWSDGPFGGSLEKTISYYDKGPVVAMLLDLAIRHQTRNASSLDGVMARLYREFYQQKKRGFSDAEFRQTCETVAGAPLDELFGYATTTKDIDYDKYLGYAGLHLEKDGKVFHIRPIAQSDDLQTAIRNSWLR